MSNIFVYTIHLHMISQLNHQTGIHVQIYDIIREGYQICHIFYDNIRDMTLRVMTLTEFFSTRSNENGLGFELL